MISIVIPTFNSEKMIIELCNEIQNYISKDDEIIIINDSSTDKTSEKLSFLNKEYENVNIYDLKSNIGQVGSTLLGIKVSKGDVIITMDDDFQHDPKFIPKLVNELNSEKSEVVVAKWDLDETFSRNFGSFMFTIISSLIIFKIPNFRNTAYRAISKEVKKDFFNFFVSRYWLDPRRISYKVHQLNVGHNPQEFRPYSSFKSRLSLAFKHLIIDSYLLQILTIGILYTNLISLLITTFTISLIQKIFRRNTKLKRKKVYEIFE